MVDAETMAYWQKLLKENLAVVPESVAGAYRFMLRYVAQHEEYDRQLLATVAGQVMCGLASGEHALKLEEASMLAVQAAREIVRRVDEPEKKS